LADRVAIRDSGTSAPPPILRKLHDPNILIEEYIYYADIQRDQEKRGLDPEQRAQQARSEEAHAISGTSARIDASEKGPKEDQFPDRNSNEEPVAASLLTDEDWENAARAYRNASWISM
jgi:hypothetical protein